MNNEETLTGKIMEHYNGSKDIKTALQNLDVATLTSDLDAVRVKKMERALSLIEVLDRIKLDPNLPVVYVGSELDIELPLLLGIHKIFMIDPIFASVEEKSKLLKKAKTYYEIIDESIDSFVVNFDYGNGVIPVQVKLRGKDYSEYLPEEPIGVLLEYLGPEPRTKFYTRYHLIKHLVKGGVLYNQGLLEHPNPSEFGFREENVLAVSDTDLDKTFDFPTMKEAIYTAQNVTQENIERMRILTYEYLNRMLKNLKPPNPRSMEIRGQTREEAIEDTKNKVGDYLERLKNRDERSFLKN